jgi:hypothetical protein
MRKKKTAGEYLAYLTVKYDVHPDILFCALLTAEEVGKAQCNCLSIEHRGKIEDETFFLIKEGNEVVAQFPIPAELLTSRRNPLRGYMETDMVKRYTYGEDQENPRERYISDLRPGMNHINLDADILKIGKTSAVGTRYGNQVLLAKAVIKNKTGEINLCLWNDQIGTVEEGDHVHIENASATKFRGKTQLTLGKTGSIQKTEVPQNEVETISSEIEITA